MIVQENLAHAEERLRFLELRAESLYRELCEREPDGRLAELVYAAATLVPGLVPTREAIARERMHPQAEKEGLELDQALFFRALLSLPSAGLDLIERMLRPTRRAMELLPRFRRDGAISLGPVLLERRGFVGHLTLCNGEVLNAEDDATVEAMETAVDLVLLDGDVHVGVIRGGEMTHPRYRGRRVFCAGINLRQLHAGQISFVDFLLRRELGYIHKIYRGAKPWIGAVDAFAIGGGAQLLLVLDHVIAASDAYFSLPAAREGIVPGLANLRLTRMTGGRLARQILLGGRSVQASEPEGARLFDEVVESEAIGAAVEAAAARLNSPAVAANRKMLALAEEPLELFRTYVAEFAYEQAQRLYAPDVVAKAWRTTP